MKNIKLKTKNVTVFAAVFILVNVLFVLSVKAQELPPKPAASRAAVVPQPFEQTLANGLRVIIVERKNVPLVTARMLIKSGGEVDPQNLAGAADMTAELLTKGTKTRTASQIAEQIEFLGGEIESGAAYDASSLTFRVMSDKLDKAMAIAADTILHPIFSQEEIDRYKTQTLDELSVNLKQPGTLAAYVSNIVVFGGGAYAHPLGGTPESIAKITRADLIKIHQTYYSPNNAVLVIAGDVNAKAAVSLAQKYFGKWLSVKQQPFKLSDKVSSGRITDKVNVNGITVIDLPGSGQAAVAAAKFGISRSDPNYFYYIVANSVLGGGYSARLNQEIRIKRGLSYGAASALRSLRDGGILTTRAQTKNESAAEVAEIMINELNKLAAAPVDETELTPRKAVLIGNFSRELETGGGLVEEIGQLALYDLPLTGINSYVQNIQSIKNGEVQFLWKRFSGDTGVNIVIVGDAKIFQPDLLKRFPGAKINVIPISDLDLNNPTFRKAQTAANAK